MKKHDSGMILKRIFAVVIAFAVMLSVITVPKLTTYAAGGRVKSIRVTNLPAKQLTLKKGKTFTLKTKVTVSGDVSRKVAYKTSNRKVATVSAKGKITARKKGKATITIYSKANKKKVCKIKVTVGTPASKVALNRTSATLIKGKKLKLKATVTPSKANVKSVIWKTSNKKIATVSKYGVVTAKKAGTVKITAVAKDGSGKQRTCTIKVINPIKITSLKATNNRTVQITISDAYKLAASDFAVMTKQFAVGSYRKSCMIDKVYTKDNKTYIITLNKDTYLYENHYVQVKLTKHNTYKEGTYSEGVYQYISASTKTVEKGVAIEKFNCYLDGFGFSSVSVTGVPKGITYVKSRAGNGTEYLIFSGTPLQTGKFTTVIKSTDELGNTHTNTITWLIYDNTHLYAAATPSYSVNSPYTRTYSSKISAGGGSGNYIYRFENGERTVQGDGYWVQITNKNNVSVKFEKAGTYQFNVVVTDADNTALTATTQMVFYVKESRKVTTCVKDLSGNPISGAYIRISNRNDSDKYSAYMSGYTSENGKSIDYLAEGNYTLETGGDNYSCFSYEYLLTVNADKEMNITLPVYKVNVALDNADIPIKEYGKWYDKMGKCVGKGNILYLEKGSYQLKMQTTGTTTYNVTLAVTVNGTASVTATVLEE